MGIFILLVSQDKDFKGWLKVMCGLSLIGFVEPFLIFISIFIFFLYFADSSIRCLFICVTNSLDNEII